jgi:catalase
MASKKETSSGHQRTEYSDQRIERGAGGETHQVASGDAPRLTTQQGIVVSDDQNTLRAGERGPDVLGDFHFREKMVRPPVRLEESW